MTYYIVPLACDYNQARTGVGPKTIKRCQTALRCGRRLRHMGFDVVFVLPTGIEPSRRWPGARTMAVMMADWLVANGECERMIINVTDGYIPFDTMGEIDWALRAIRCHQQERNCQNPNSLQINDMSEATVVFVSNRKHLRRAHFILRLMHGLPRSLLSGPDAFTADGLPIFTDPEIQMVVSGEEPPTIFHEFLGYGKVILTWAGWLKR